MLTNIGSQISAQFLADGLSAANSIGPVLLGLAMGMYLFLRVLQAFSRRFVGKDFRVYPVQRRNWKGEPKVEFRFAVGKWERRTVADASALEGISGDISGRNAQAWNEIALFLSNGADSGMGDVSSWRRDVSVDRNAAQALEDGDSPEE